MRTPKAARDGREVIHRPKPGRVMPILPLDHPESVAATLGSMLYPGEDDASQKRAPRAWAAQFLAEPVQRFLEARGTLAHEELARLHADSGVPLDDLKVRWRDGTVARLPVTAEAEILHRWGRTWRAERAKAEPPLSRTVKRTVGSNPTLSAM